MNVRHLALEAIVKILHQGGYSNIVINGFLSKYELSDENKALFTRLVKGTVEHQLTLNYYLEPFLKKKQKPWVQYLLLMSIYQIVFLNTPDYAAVNESVEIASLKDRGVAAFINAVLRNFLRNERRSLEGLNEISELSIRYSYPDWLVAFFLKDYTYKQVKQLFEEYESVSYESIRINTLKTTKEAVISTLQSEGIFFDVHPLVQNGLIVHQSMMHHRLFIDGHITIQDIASQLTSEILDPKPESIMIDLCSAPGGKTAHCSALMHNTGLIHACDIHEHKLRLMNKTFQRLGVTNVEAQLIDARRIKDHVHHESFDAILADLPCSGLGVIGSKMDLKYHMTKDIIDEVTALQAEILDATALLVKKGGTYVYSTCTLNKNENEYQIRRFIDRFPIFTIEYEQTLLPYEHHTDGFYICKMRRHG